MRKILIIFGIFGILVCCIVFYLVHIEWIGWTAIAAMSAFITCLSIIFLGYQILIQNRTNSLDQVNYLMSLAQSFKHYKSDCNDAWKILVKYKELPKEMSWKEFYYAEDALKKYYQNALFLYQIAKIVNNKIVSLELIYLLYYNEIIDESSSTFRFLIKWCGTGVELAADYDSSEIARMINPVSQLLKNLGDMHEKHNGKRYNHIEEAFKEFEKAFVPNAETYTILSEGNSNYISIIDDIKAE